MAPPFKGDFFLVCFWFTFSIRIVESANLRVHLVESFFFVDEDGPRRVECVESVFQKDGGDRWEGVPFFSTRSTKVKGRVIQVVTFRSPSWRSLNF